MATDYFVKTDGNDGNNGTTWALAKATIQAGMNLCSTAGDRCVVAAGTYYETALTPPSAGTRGTNKVLYGDYDGTVADGGAATSGVTGYVIIDGSLQSGNYGRSTALIFATADAWAYWDLSNLYCRGADRVQVSPATPATANDGVTMTNLVVEGGLTGFGMGTWTTDSDTYSPITWDRVIAVTRRLYGSGDIYNTGLYFSNRKSTAFTTNPNLVMKRCIGIGACGGLAVDGNISTAYTFASAQNCTFISFVHASENPSRSNAIWGSSSTYSKYQGTDCYYEGAQKANAALTVASDTRPKTYTYNVAGALTTMPLLPLISYLYPGSPLIDVAGGGGTYPDIFQIASVQGSDDDCGAQEYVSGQYPLEPTMDISNLTTVTPGPSTGGGLSRGRVVNAGGI